MIFRVLLSTMLLFQLACVTAIAGGMPSHGKPTGTISLDDAYAAALRQSPELAAASDEIRAREALAGQAARRPNPLVQTEVENIGVSGDRSGFDDTETTLLLSQLIELGGKRSKRARVAEIGRDLARWDFEAKRLDVLSRVRRAFITVLAAQARIDLVRERRRVATEEVNAATRSVSAGASSPFELSRARLTLERAGLELAQSESELRAARDSLAATWRGEAAAFTRATGKLEDLPRLPAENELARLVPSSPDVARWTSEREERRATLGLEEAGSVPDVTAGIGARHFSDNSDNALVFEVSVPLPLFDRNRDSVAAARARLSKAEHEAAAASAGALAAIHEAYRRCTAARENAERLAGSTLPAARAARENARSAFRQGAVRRIDVLEAERTVFELETEYVGVLEAAHLAAADVERLAAIELAHADAAGV